MKIAKFPPTVQNPNLTTQVCILFCGFLENFSLEHIVHLIFGQIQLFFREMKKPNFPNTLIISAALNKPQNIIQNF